MQIKRIVVGILKTNCYLLIKDDNCLIIDPGADYKIIKDIIGTKKVLGILITHRHFDHIGALEELIAEYNVMVYDNGMGEVINQIGPFTFEIIESKGHAKDAITFYFKEDGVMFCGDFLFKGTIGRTDLPSGNDDDMVLSLKKIKEYSKDIKIYPGHGNESSLGYEFENNPYLKNI